MANAGTNDAPDAVWRLRVGQEHRDGLLVVTIAGRLAAADTPRLASVLAEAVAAGDRRILLDLKGLDYISSAGIIALQATAARLRSLHGELILSELAPPVRLALELGGFPDGVGL